MWTTFSHESFLKTNTHPVTKFGVVQRKHTQWRHQAIVGGSTEATLVITAPALCARDCHGTEEVRVVWLTATADYVTLMQLRPSKRSPNDQRVSVSQHTVIATTSYYMQRYQQLAYIQAVHHTMHWIEAPCPPRQNLVHFVHWRLQWLFVLSCGVPISIHCWTYRILRMSK